VITVETCVDDLQLGEFCMNQTFVHDKVKPAGPMPQGLFSQASDAAWRKVSAKAAVHEQSWSPWMDFHTGLKGEVIDVQALLRDGVSMQDYSDHNVLRLNLPGTISTVEFADDVEHPSELNATAGVPAPDRCRRTEPEPDTPLLEPPHWWKSTFAALDPEASPISRSLLWAGFRYLILSLGLGKVIARLCVGSTFPLIVLQESDRRACPMVSISLSRINSTSRKTYRRWRLS